MDVKYGGIGRNGNSVGPTGMRPLPAMTGAAQLAAKEMMPDGGKLSELLQRDDSSTCDALNSGARLVNIADDADCEPRSPSLGMLQLLSVDNPTIASVLYLLRRQMCKVQS